MTYKRLVLCVLKRQLICSGANPGPNRNCHNAVTNLVVCLNGSNKAKLHSTKKLRLVHSLFFPSPLKKTMIFMYRET
jgi:hypothetical protein